MRIAWNDIPLMILAIVIAIPLLARLLEIVRGFLSDAWEFGLWG